MRWFTSDQHFFHENIIKYTGRPFSSARRMNLELIRRYCEKVQPEDIVFMLGDFTMAGVNFKPSVAQIVDQLPGTKILILGNHDSFKPFEYVEMGFQSVHTALDIGEFVLAHDPATSIVRQDKKWLCGHVHNLFLKQKNVVNVGVDVWDYYPVSIEEVRKLYE